ncbi:MAG: OmpA family protein [Oceanospirillales bacterium]|nr:OmpA family protein [Oceanospirillales bacterium]
MIRTAATLGSALLLLGLSGCTVYSGAVNTFGPDKPVSDVAANTDGELLLSKEPPPFCPAPVAAADDFDKVDKAMPAAPIYKLVYFKFDSDELTEQSRRDAEEIYQEVLKREAPEVLVTGHTDTSGSAALNDSLSKRRAEAVREDLIEIGVDADTIRTYYKGESEPLIDTGDGVKELRNRRVEINVR